jgi:hypothetical protein
VDVSDIDPNALHEQYLAEFALDEPAVRTLPAGWQVRVKRQLVRPAGVAAPLMPASGDGAVWELGEGTGHGARLVVTWTGTDPAARDAARTELPRRVRELAATIAG